MQCLWNSMEVGYDSSQFNRNAIAIRCNPISCRWNYIADQCDAIATRCSPIANRYNGIVIRLYFVATSIASLYQSDVVPLHLNSKSLAFDRNSSQFGCIPIAMKTWFQFDVKPLQFDSNSARLHLHSIATRYNVSPIANRWIRCNPTSRRCNCVALHLRFDAIRLQFDEIISHFDCSQFKCNSIQIDCNQIAHRCSSVAFRFSSTVIRHSTITVLFEWQPISESEC
jgi:hypothetical protein